MEGFITEFGGSKNGFFKRNIYKKRDENFADGVEKFLKEFNNTDAYYGVYNYENSNVETCALYGSLYIDLDLDIEDEDSFHKVKTDAVMTVQYFQTYFKIPMDMLQVYFSGNKGFHVVVPAEILGLTPNVDLNVIYKAIAVNIKEEIEATTIDTRIYDRKRLFRMPNSVNGKTGLYKVPVPIDMLWGCTLDTMKKWASKPREIHFADPLPLYYSVVRFRSICDKLAKSKEKTANREKKEFVIPTTPKSLLPCVKKILTTGAAKGQRNNTTVALASSLLQSGKQLKETIEVLEEWNELNDPPLDENELHTTAVSAYSMLKSGKTYGCGVFKDIGMCIGKECKLNE